MATFLKLGHPTHQTTVIIPAGEQAPTLKDAHSVAIQAKIELPEVIERELPRLCRENPMLSAIIESAFEAGRTYVPGPEVGNRYDPLRI